MWMLCRGLETVIAVFAGVAEPVLFKLWLWSIGYGVQHHGIGEIGLVGAEELSSNEFFGYLYHPFLAGELAGEEQGCGCGVFVYTRYVPHLCFAVLYCKVERRRDTFIALLCTVHGKVEDAGKGIVEGDCICEAVDDTPGGDFHSAV